MKSILVNMQLALLLISGILLLVIGALIIVTPGEFYGSYNIDLAGNVNLLNELKAPAGLLLAAGIYILSAALIRNRRKIALVLAALIFLSYAASRALSMAIDGVPASSLIMATVLEAVIGLGCLWFLMSAKAPIKQLP